MVNRVLLLFIPGSNPGHVILCKGNISVYFSPLLQLRDPLNFDYQTDHVDIYYRITIELLAVSTCARIM